MDKKQISGEEREEEVEKQGMNAMIKMISEINSDKRGGGGACLLFHTSIENLLSRLYAHTQIAQIEIHEFAQTGDPKSRFVCRKREQVYRTKPS